MSSTGVFGRRCAGAVLAGGLALAFHHPASAEPNALFKALEGIWRGNGTIKAGPDKPEEPMRCRIEQELAGANSLKQSIKCASTSVRLFGSGKLRYDPATGIYSGTFEASGDSGKSTMTGRGTARSLNMTVTHTGYKKISNSSGTLSIRILGPARHVVTLFGKQPGSGRLTQVYRVVYTR